MPHPVFLSYARAASRSYAQAVYEALGGAEEGLAFLDTEDIELGDRFPDRIVDALLAARVVVIFAEPVYFTRWYCLLEYRVARTPFLKNLEPGGSLPREAALAPLVLAMPPSGMPPEVDRFPPIVQVTNWPSVDAPADIAALVRQRLERSPSTLGELLDQVGASSLQAELREATRLPPPLPTGRIPRAPLAIRPSIRGAFVGRADDLWRIDDLLVTQEGGSTATAALTGAIEGGGGIGKTRLALEYLHRFGPKRFPGGLFWIDAAGDAASLEQRHHEILQALDPTTPSLATYRDPEQARSIVGDLQRVVDRLPPEKAALFVVDNVPEPEAGSAAKPLEHWCPVVGLAPVLATSRRSLSVGQRGTVTGIPVDVLGAEASVLLLTLNGRYRDALGEQEWQAIVDWVGRLPLALELLSAGLDTKSITPAVLLAQARAQDVTATLDGIMDALRHVVPEGTLQGVSEAFLLSYERLSTSEKDAARLLAWLAPEPIPEALIEAFGAEPFSPAVRATLVTGSFVGAVDSGNVATYGAMHRVLADFLRTQSPDPMAELEQVGEAILSIMTEERYEDPREWPLLMAALPHAQAALAGIRSRRESAAFVMIANLENQIGSVLNLRGLNREAEVAFRQVLEACRSAYSEEHPNTIKAMHNVAFSLWMQGSLEEAQDLQQRVLELSLRVLSEEHEFTIMAMNNLSVTQHARGNLAGARFLQERALAPSQRVHGREHIQTIHILSNLANTLFEQGELDPAYQLRQQVLALSQGVLRPEHPDMITAMGSLAISHKGMGRLAEARALEERALDFSRRSWGDDHRETLAVMSNLAATLSRQREFDAAYHLQERVLELSLRVLGEEHPNTLTAMNNFASLLEVQGQPARARALLEQVLLTRCRLLGGSHPATQISVKNLAAMLRALGEFGAARELEKNPCTGAINEARK